VEGKNDTPFVPAVQLPQPQPPAESDDPIFPLPERDRALPDDISDAIFTISSPGAVLASLPEK